jgi:hypothetical protein
VTPRLHHEYAYYLAENEINTDDSLFPWQSIATTRSLVTDTVAEVQRNTTSSEASTLLYYARSHKTYRYDRSYYKLLSALSYLGGMFQALLGLFLFAGVIGRVLYELSFARTYFQSHVLHRFTLRMLLGQGLYNCLAAYNCAPDWEDHCERLQLQTTVNKLLDIVYLSRRIDFLERAVAVLLEEHQLKGLHLAHHITRQEADRQIGNHRLKSRLRNYLFLRSILHPQPQPSSPSPQPQSYLHRKVVEIELFPERGRDQSQEEVMSSEVKMGQPPEGRQSEGMGFEVLRFSDFSHGPSDPNHDQELDLLLLRDMRVLFHEAEKEDGDPRSKRVYELLDEEMKGLLRVFYEPLLPSKTEIRSPGSLEEV